MNPVLIRRATKRSLGICSVLCCLLHANAAQFIEVTAEIDVTNWLRNGTERHSTHTARCVLGTNAWMMEHDFVSNATVTYWFTGMLLVEHTFITKKLEDTLITKKPQGRRTKGTLPEVGTRSSQVLPSMPGGARDRGGFENVPWLAFCSSACLKNTEAIIPRPLWFDHSRYTRKYTATFSLFEDTLGLPVRIDFHTPDNHLLCHYEVQQSTNFLGWSLPVRFEAIGYRHGTNGTWEADAQAVGRLVSFRSAERPELPAHVVEQIRRNYAPHLPPL